MTTLTGLMDLYDRISPHAQLALAALTTPPDAELVEDGRQVEAMWGGGE